MGRRALTPDEDALGSALRRGRLFDVALAVDPSDPRLDGILWDDRPALHPTWSSPWVVLTSSAETPFAIGHERFASLETFYHALKLPEGSAERARCAAATAYDAYQMVRRLRGPVFTWRGSPVEVGSRAHDALVAGAVEAKVAAHSSVRACLRETGMARLTVGRFRPITSLGRAMTFALMVARWRGL